MLFDCQADGLGDAGGVEACVCELLVSGVLHDPAVWDAQAVDV